MLKYVNLARVENITNEMTPEELQHYHVQLNCLIGSVASVSLAMRCLSLLPLQET